MTHPLRTVGTLFLACSFFVCGAAGETLLLRGSVEQKIDRETVSLEYLLHMPENPRGQKYPAVFFFHGNGGRGEDWINNSEINGLIGEGKFIGIFPSGHNRSWNLGYERSKANDILFIQSIIDSLKLQSFVDRQRIFAVGVSNGAALVNKLGKETDFFKAIAVIVSQQMVSLGETNLASPLSVFQVNGELDDLVPKEGGLFANGSSEIQHNFMSADLSAADWATRLSCDGEKLSEVSFWGASEVESHVYSGCINGQLVAYHIVNGQGHQIHIDNFYERIWNFFTYPSIDSAFGKPVDLDSTGEQLAKITIEEPVDTGTASGVSNIRGWALSKDGIERLELFIDGNYVSTIPYGGNRRDVENAFPQIQNSIASGFGQTFNYGLLGSGPHTMSVHAYTNNGTLVEATADFFVASFNDPFIDHDDFPDLSSGTISLDKEGGRIRIRNLLLEDGSSHQITLQWNKASQGFEITNISD